MAVLGIYVRCLGCNTPVFCGGCSFTRQIIVWSRFGPITMLYCHTLHRFARPLIGGKWRERWPVLVLVNDSKWYERSKKSLVLGYGFFRVVIGGFLDNHFEMYETLAKLGDSQSQEYAWWNQECCWVWTCIASEYRMTLKIVNLKSEKNNNVIPEHVCLSKHDGFCKRKLYRNVQASLQSSHLEQHKYLFWIHAS